MAYAPSRGLTDLFGGQHDLETHVIRAVGDHPTVLKRMPYVFCAPSGSLLQLDFALEEHTLCAALLYGENLAKISAERVAAELMKSLAGQRPSALGAVAMQRSAFLLWAYLYRAWRFSIAGHASAGRRFASGRPVPDLRRAGACRLRRAEAE